MQPMRPDDPWKRLKVLQDKLDGFIAEQRSSMRALGATTIDKGDLTVKGGGGVVVEDGGDVTIKDGGGVRVEDGGDLDILGGGRVLIRDDGELLILGDNGEQWVFRIRGDGALSMIDEATNRGMVLFGGNLRFYPDVDDPATFARVSTSDDGTLLLDSPEGISIVTGGDLRMYELPTSTQAGNLRLQIDEGIPRIYYGTASNANLKPDLQPLDLDPADVLAIEVHEWSEGEHRVIGVTAEQLKTVETIAPLLIRPRYGGGDTVEYDRLPILQQVVLRDHETRLAKLEAENAALRAQMKALTDRLDALEATP